MIEKKRRRTCADRLRRDLVERQRQRRGGDPAGKALLQLLGILSGVLALLPPLPAFSIRRSFPKSVSSPPAGGVQSYFYDTDDDDEDRGPTAYAMERGLEPLHYATSRLRPPPSWSRLVKDLARSRKADHARELLEARVPAAAVEWLRDTIDAGDLWRLRMIVRPGATDDEIAAAMLAATQAWKAERQQSVQPKPEEPAPPETGPVPEIELPDDAADDPDNAGGPKP